MKTQLLPNYFKKVGLILFFLGFIFTGLDDFREGFFESYLNGEESIDQYFKQYWSEGWILFWNLCSVGGVILYALSREKKEDEWYKMLRFETGWITFIICLGILFVSYSIFGEVELSIDVVINLPVSLFLIIFFFRKRQFEGELA